MLRMARCSPHKWLGSLFPNGSYEPCHTTPLLLSSCHTFYTDLEDTVAAATNTMTPYYDQAHEVAPAWERPMIASGAIAGLLYIGSMALIIRLVAPQLAPMDAPATQHAAFYAQQAHNPIYTLIRYLIMAQLAPLSLFFGALFSRLRRAEGGNGALAVAVLVAGVMTTLITPLVEMIEGHLLLGLAAAGGDPVVTRNFDGMTPVSFALSCFPQAVVLGGTAL